MPYTNRPQNVSCHSSFQSVMRGMKQILLVCVVSTTLCILFMLFFALSHQKCEHNFSPLELQAIDSAFTQDVSHDTFHKYCTITQPYYKRERRRLKLHLLRLKHRRRMLFDDFKNFLIQIWGQLQKISREENESYNLPSDLDLSHLEL